mmetsp:Transcript_13172/g.20504  ORF Transcript_13172/g.20504 Transcript_13172/m.20504 type:complete len:112 (+) Transcript_13172:187-522(+)
MNSSSSGSAGNSSKNEAKPAKKPEPVLPFGVVPSKEYENVQLREYYFGDLDGSPDTVGKHQIYANINKFKEKSQLDQYFTFYTFDAKKELGTNYKVALNSTLQQIGTDIKL